MARVVALIPDLLFGSRVLAALGGAGHEVQLVGDSAQVRELLAGDGDGAPVSVLVVDLTREELDGAGLIEALLAEGALQVDTGAIRTLGFYSHVEAEVRERAERAGFDMVVPRSRMAREGAELVTRLATAPA